MAIASTLAQGFASRQKGRLPRVAFFSRGRGSGHAVPDLAIAEEARKLAGAFDIDWISYGTGAATIRNSGKAVIDIGLPEENPFLETQLRATRILAALKPDLVVSHEEFAALPAAKVFGCPTVFVTDYFVGAAHLWMQCLSYADEVVFIDDPGIFEEPPPAQGRTYYTGPIVRNFTYSRSDRRRARNELGLPLDATVLIVLPGSWNTEARAPIFDRVVEAFRMLPAVCKYLVWFAGADYELLSSRTADIPGLIVKDFDWCIDRWMAACDLAVTKGTRKTAAELHYLGVRSISLETGLNPIDEIRVRRIPTNTALCGRDVSAEALAEVCTGLLARTGPSWEDSGRPTVGNGLGMAAERLAQRIDAVRRNRFEGQKVETGEI